MFCGRHQLVSQVTPTVEGGMMYTITLSPEDTKRYRSAYHWRTVFQADADQQMTSRLEAVGNRW